MKNVLFTLLLIVFSISVYSKPINIQTTGMESFASDIATEQIEKGISDTTFYTYWFKLLQEGDKFTITYNVTPGDIKGSMKTDNIWDGMETTINNAIKDINAQISSQQVNSVSNQNNNLHPSTNGQNMPNNPHSSIQQPVQQYQPPVQQQQPPVQQQPAQYQPPVGKQVAEQPSREQKSSGGGSFSGWITNTFGKAYSDDVIANIRVNDYTLADVSNGSAQIGGRIRFADGTQGIIYYLDGKGHGLAVSLDQTECKWQEATKSKYCQDIYQVSNEKNVDTYCNIGLGQQYSSAIWAQIGYQAPAVVWCMGHGDGWYLPSAGELWQLLSVANDNKGQAGVISLMLQAAGGTPLNSKWYWSSSEENLENAHNISSFGTKASEDKTSKNAVRAVRAL